MILVNASLGKSCSLLRGFHTIFGYALPRVFCTSLLFLIIILRGYSQPSTDDSGATIAYDLTDPQGELVVEASQTIWDGHCFYGIDANGKVWESDSLLKEPTKSFDSSSDQNGQGDGSDQQLSDLANLRNQEAQDDTGASSHLNAHLLNNLPAINQVLVQPGEPTLLEDAQGKYYTTDGREEKFDQIKEQDRETLLAGYAHYPRTNNDLGSHNLSDDSQEPLMQASPPLDLSFHRSLLETPVTQSLATEIPEQWQWDHLGYLGANPNALAPNGSGKTLLECYQAGVDPNTPLPEEPFSVSLGAQGPFSEPAKVTLAVSVSHRTNHKIAKAELYRINAQNQASICTRLDAQGRMQPFCIRFEPYEFIQEKLLRGKYTYEVRVYDETGKYQKARTSFEVLAPRCYKRGWGDDFKYLSEITPLDGEKGVFLDGINDCFMTLYKDKKHPWFLRSHSLLDEPCFHIYYDPNEQDNSKKIQYRQVNWLPHQHRQTIGSQPPMVAFGSEGGGTPLYPGQWYSFDVLGGKTANQQVAGGPGTTFTLKKESNDILIEVYRKEDFKDNKENVYPIAKVEASIPNMSYLMTLSWERYQNNHFVYDLPKPKTITGEEIDFSTQIIGLEINKPTFRISHRAGNSDYYYRISLKGDTDNPFSKDNHYASNAGRAINGPKTKPAYNISYTLDFNKDNITPLSSKIEEPPHFQMVPLPSAYQGKNLDELIHHPQPIRDTLPGPGRIKFDLKSLERYGSPDLKTHPLLDKLAQDLGSDPITIANYVQNEIDLTDVNAFTLDSALGLDVKTIRRDALGTYLEGQGSPWEQCTLLIYLLRKAGVACGYVIPDKGTTYMFDKQLSAMLKTQLRNLNTFSSIPNLEIVPISYPWVVAYIEGKWVHLFPWIKDTEVVEKKNLWNYFPQGYQNSREWTLQYLLNDPTIRLLDTNEDSVDKLLPLYAEQQLKPFGLTLDDVGVEYHNREHYYAHWEDFPRPWKTPLISEKNLAKNLDASEHADNPEIKDRLTDIFDTVSIQVFSDRNKNGKYDNGEPMLQTGPMRLADLHNRRILLYHEPVAGKKGHYNMILDLEAYDDSEKGIDPIGHFNTSQSAQDLNKVLRPEQNIRTELQTTNDSNNDDLLWFKVTLSLGGQTKEVLRPLHKGDTAAFCLDYGRVTPKMQLFEAKKYWDYQQYINMHPDTKVSPIKNMGQLLHLMGQSYYLNCDRFNGFANKICKETLESQFSYGLTSLTPSHNKDGSIATESHNGVDDIALTFPRVDMHIDAHGNAVNNVGENWITIDSVSKTQYLELANSSAQEHRIINQFFGLEDAVSTVKLLDIAQGWTPETMVASHPGEGIIYLDQLNQDDEYSRVTYYDQDILLDGFKYKAKPGQTVHNWLNKYGLLQVIDNTLKQGGFCLVSEAPVKAPWHHDWEYVGMGAFICNPIYSLEAAISPPYEPTERPSTFRDNIPLNGAYAGSLPYSFFTTTEDSSSITNSNLILPNSGEPQYQPSNQDYFDWSSLNASRWNAANALSSNNPSTGGGDAKSPNVQMTPDLASMTQGYQSQCLLGFSEGGILNGNQLQSDYNYLINNIMDTGYVGEPHAYNNADSWLYDPVNPATGEFYIDAVDLSMKGPMPLDIRRTYGSQNQADNNFGFGWKLSEFPYLGLSSDLKEEGKENSDAKDPKNEKEEIFNENHIPTLIYGAEADGSVVAYRYQEGSEPKVWIPRSKDNPTLYNNPQGKLEESLRSKNLFNNRIVSRQEQGKIEYELYGSDGSIRHYLVREYPIIGNEKVRRRRPYLESWEDGNGNYLTFERGSQRGEEDWGQLKVIRANNGNTLHFSYDLYGHITDAFANDGRHLKYEYDSYGDLVQVTLPDGSVTKYSYEHKEAAPIDKTKEQKSDSEEKSEPSQKEAQEDSRKETSSKLEGPSTYSTHLIIKEEKPEGRLLENSYDGERRVIVQSARTGASADIKANATFDYDLSKKKEDQTYSGKTTVRDVLGHTMSYKIEGNEVVAQTNQNGETKTTQWEVGPNSRQKGSETDLRGLKTDYHYDDRGNLLQITQSGNLTGKNNNESATTSLTYTPGNLLESITNPLGEKSVYAYSDHAHPYLPTSITGPGSLITKKYVDQGGGGLSACGLLSQVNKNGAITDYGYDTHGFLASKKEETGSHDGDRLTHYQSNRRGEIISTTLPSGSIIRNDYDAIGHPTWKETYDPNGNIIDWEYTYYNGNGEPTWHQGAQFNPVDYSYKTYDHMGRVTEESLWRSQARLDGSGITDAGVATTFHLFDDYGNELQTVDHNHNMTTMTYDKVGNMLQMDHRQGDNPNSPILSSEYFTYQPGGDVIKHVTPLGATEQMSYNSRGQLIAKTQADGTTIAYRYDLLGRVTEELLPSGAHWMTSYNDTDHLVTKSYQTSSGSQLGEEKRHYDGRGNLLTFTDLGGNTFTKSYDGLNRVKSETGPHDPNSPAQTTFHVYNDTRNSEDSVNGKGEHTLTFFDPLQRPVWQGTYNRGGDLAAESSDWYAPDHHSQIHDQGSGQEAIETTIYFDEGKRPVITREANDPPQISNFDPNGNLISSQDELGHQTNWEYDGLNRAIIKTLPASAGAERASVASEYDPAGNLITQTLPEGIVDHIEYNQAGQKLHQFTQDRQGKISDEYSYSYGTNGNAAGKLVSSSDPRGFTTSYNYDDWGNLSEQTSSGGREPNQNQSTTYSYDPRGLLTAVDQTTEGSPSTQVKRDYDAYQQLISEAITINNQPFTSWQQSWDPAGRRVSLGGKTKTASSQTLAPSYSFDYNAPGNITLASNNLNKGNQAHYSYNSAGLLQQRENPYLQETLRRDTRGRIMGREVNGSSGNLLTETMSWEPNNQMASYNSATPGGETRNMAYQYNGRGALLNEQTGANTATGNHHAFQYLYDQNPLQTGESREDGLNILTTQILPTFNNSLLSHQVTGQSNLGQVTAEKVANSITQNDYDVAGNTTAMVDQQGGGKELTWDSLNRLIQVNQSSGEGSSNWKTIYDGLGRRLQTSYKTGEGAEQIINYYYDPNISFMELGHSVATQSGNQTTWNLYGPDRSGSYGGMQGIGGLDLVTTITNGDSHTQALLNNSFGDATAKIAANGTVTPYQTTLSSFGPVDAPNQDLEPEWRGHYMDPTGFYYFGARYYDPSGGRFLSQDPMGRNASMSLYDYCGNDPVNALDPDGKLKKEIGQYAESANDWGEKNNVGTRILGAGQVVGGAAMVGISDASYAIPYVGPYVGSVMSTIVQPLGILEMGHGGITIGTGDYSHCITEDLIGGINDTIGIVEEKLNLPQGSLTGAALLAESEFSPYLPLVFSQSSSILRNEEALEEIEAISSQGMGNGYGVNDPPVRISGKWEEADLKAGLQGKPPRSLNRPDLHHADQMPGSAIHEIIPSEHRGNPLLHPNKFNQGVTPEMRMQDRRLHWWYRAREQGADQYYPNFIYD